MDINAAFEILINFEGTSFTDYKNDNGGETRYGVSKASYPNLDIANLTEDKAKAIYGTDYWIEGNCAKVKVDLQYPLFDFAVNAGVVTAIKLLQKCCGITEDGKFGSLTLMQSDNISVEKFLLYRQWFYNDIAAKNPSQIEFLDGWTNRVKKIYEMYVATWLIVI